MPSVLIIADTHERLAEMESGRGGMVYLRRRAGEQVMH
jgi:hypothetical protein